MKIKVENLIASQMLQPSESVSASEHVVALAMEPSIEHLLPLGVLENAERLVGVTTIARTGGIFVFSGDDADAIYQSDWNPGELPPLPYVRCWFEVWSEDEQKAYPLVDWIDHDGQHLVTVAFGVTEIEQCTEWRVYSVNYEPMEDGQPKDGHAIIVCWDILAGAQIQEYMQTGEGDAKVVGRGSDDDLNDVKIAIRQDKVRTAWMRSASDELQSKQMHLNRVPIAMAQAIDVVGVRHTPLTIPRPARRRHLRRFGVEHPNIYFVDLRSTGDEERIGVSDILYRHRWIVRGHYRRDSSGRFTVPGKGVCTWVRPYVKGPPGAPWKGRPIYVA